MTKTCYDLDRMLYEDAREEEELLRAFLSRDKHKEKPTGVFNQILDYVTEVQNSKSWPSDDSNDSPENTFTCKLCGWEFRSRVFGEFPIGVDPYIDVKKKVIEHLAVRHQIYIPIQL